MITTQMVGQFIWGNVAIRIFSLLNLIVLTPLLLRIWGVEIYGQYSYLTGLMLFLSVLIGFGGTEYLQLFGSSTTQNTKRVAIFSSVIALRFVIIPIAMGVVYCILYFDWFATKVDKSLALIVALGGAVYVVHIMNGVLNTMGRFVSYYWSQILHYGFGAGAVVYALYSGQTIQWLLTAEVLIITMASVYVVWHLRDHIRYTHIDWETIKQTSKGCVGLALASGLIYILPFIDRYFLSLYFGDYELGLYGLAVFMVMGIMGLLQPCLTFLQGILISSLRNKDSLLEYDTKTFFVYAYPLLIMPFILGMAVYGEPFVVLYGGVEFTQSHGFVQWLALGVSVSAFVTFYWHLFLAEDANRIRYSIMVYGFVVVLNVLLNQLFIPYWGAIGVVMASFCAYGILAFCMVFVTTRHGFNRLRRAYFTPWVGIILIYSIGAMVWRPDYGIVATFVFSGLSMMALVVWGFCFKESRTVLMRLIKLGQQMVAR